MVTKSPVETADPEVKAKIAAVVEQANGKSA